MSSRPVLGSGSALRARAASRRHPWGAKHHEVRASSDALGPPVGGETPRGSGFRRRSGTTLGDRNTTRFGLPATPRGGLVRCQARRQRRFEGSGLRVLPLLLAQRSSGCRRSKTFVVWAVELNLSLSGLCNSARPERPRHPLVSDGYRLRHSLGLGFRACLKASAATLSL